MTTTPPGTTELVAECAALLPFLRWELYVPPESVSRLLKAPRCAVLGLHDLIFSLRAVVELMPGGEYAVQLSHHTGDGDWGVMTDAAARAPTLREAYSIARDRYDHARMVQRPDFPEVAP